MRTTGNNNNNKRRRRKVKRVLPARSWGFLKPAKAILVPGMYFLGFSR